KFFHEGNASHIDWDYEQTSVATIEHYSGRSGVIYWERGEGELYKFGRENVKTLHNVDRRGEQSWGQHGISISMMGDLPASLYSGNKFDTNSTILIPRNKQEREVLYTFFSSKEFNCSVRILDQSLKVTNSTFSKVTFNYSYWLNIAKEQYPQGLPEPYSNDPTQWIFH
ncbi:SAM-dependent DNA methyltransferase, partial [Aeromonas veronii]